MQRVTYLFAANSINSDFTSKRFCKASPGDQPVRALVRGHMNDLAKHVRDASPTFFVGSPIALAR